MTCPSPESPLTAARLSADVDEIAAVARGWGAVGRELTALGHRLDAHRALLGAAAAAGARALAESPLGLAPPGPELLAGAAAPVAAIRVFEETRRAAALLAAARSAARRLGDGLADDMGRLLLIADRYAEVDSAIARDFQRIVREGFSELYSGAPPGRVAQLLAGLSAEAAQLDRPPPAKGPELRPEPAQKSPVRRPGNSGETGPAPGSDGFGAGSQPPEAGRSGPGSHRSAVGSGRGGEPAGPGSRTGGHEPGRALPSPSGPARRPRATQPAGPGGSTSPEPARQSAGPSVVASSGDAGSPSRLPSVPHGTGTPSGSVPPSPTAPSAGPADLPSIVPVPPLGRGSGRGADSPKGGQPSPSASAGAGTGPGSGTGAGSASGAGIGPGSGPGTGPGTGAPSGPVGAAGPRPAGRPGAGPGRGRIRGPRAQPQLTEGFSPPELHQLTGWIDAAFSVLSATGVPDGLLDADAVLAVIRHESDGNPGAVNEWDENALRGDPSRGLMQTTGETFREYALPGYNGNVFDPVDNIIAACRYAIDRYGSLDAIPGVQALRYGRPYVGY